MSSFKWSILICSIFGLGCADKQQFSKFDVACEKHAIVYDSFYIELLEVDEKENKINSLKRISPENDVIGQAIFNCQNGALLFDTVERMKSGVGTKVHINFKNSEKKLDFKYGVNSIIPYGSDQYVVREQIIRGGNGIVVKKESLPVMSMENLDEDEILQKSTYIDDVILDVKTLEVLRKIPGTFDPHEFHGGKYITYTANKVALNFNPQNGDRTILVDYRKDRKQGRNSIDLPQKGSQYFYLNGDLYLVNGESPANMIDHNSNYLEKNKIFKYHGKNKKWVSLVDLDDNPILIIHNNEKIIILGRKSAFEYNYILGISKKFDIPLSGYSWKSIAELQNTYLIIGESASNETDIFLSSKDFSVFKKASQVNYLANPRISTMLTPIPPKQILQ